MLEQEQLRLLRGLLTHLDAKTNVDAGGIMQTLQILILARIGLISNGSLSFKIILKS